MKRENEDIQILKRVVEFYFKEKEEKKSFISLIKKFTPSKIREEIISNLDVEHDKCVDFYAKNNNLLKKLEGVPVFDYKAIEELENVFLKHGILDPRGDVCKKIIDELRSIRKPF
jgi:hypothetical protein